MSELKEHLFCECDECIREYRGPLSNEMRPYYLKSEADRYIAELQSANQLEIDEWYNKLMCQKYKRCLAMARMCEERSARYDLLQERTGFDWSREIGFYFKWQQRWLMIAEQFNDKEAK